MFDGYAKWQSILEFIFFLLPLVFQRSKRVKRFKTQRNLKYNKNSIHYNVSEWKAIGLMKIFSFRYNNDLAEL